MVFNQHGVRFTAVKFDATYIPLELVGVSDLVPHVDSFEWLWRSSQNIMKALHKEAKSGTVPAHPCL